MNNTYLTPKVKSRIFKVVLAYTTYKIGEYLGSPHILPYLGALIVMFIFWYGFFELIKK